MQRSGASPGSGTLYKLSVSGFRGRAWAKRHFVFSGQTLAYYTSLEAYERQERPRKVVDLTNCRVEDTGMERWTSKARRVRGLSVCHSRAPAAPAPQQPATPCRGMLLGLRARKAACGRSASVGGG